MPEYHVLWKVDVEADSPEEAARQARTMQVRPGTTATVFDVIEGDSDGDAVRVDLLGLEEEGVVDEGD